MNSLAFMILATLGVLWFLMVPVAVLAFPLGIVRWFKSKPRYELRVLKFLVGVPFTVGLLLIYFFFVDPISIDRTASAEIAVRNIRLNESLAIGLVDLLLIGNLAVLVYQLKGRRAGTGTIIGSVTLAHYCCNVLLVLPILERHASMTMT